MKRSIYTTHKIIIPLITDKEKLAQLLDLNSNELFGNDLNNFRYDFPLKVSRSFALRMRKKDMRDPLLLQILPQEQEFAVSNETAEYTTNPLQETKYSPIPGLIHKYAGRVLLLVTRSCPMNCRFCFRRYIRNHVENWQAVFDYIKQDSTITEVILSGGEPLLWMDNKLDWLLQQLFLIPNVQRIRFHTRAPITIPERISNNLLRIFAKQKGPLIFVIHCNHPQEIDKTVVRTLEKMRNNNCMLFNQSVLLKGINDNADVLMQLSEKLFAAGVVPYYLHMLDKVKGSACFYVDVDTAKSLVTKMREMLPGYLVPKLVKEVSDCKSKVFI